MYIFLTGAGSGIGRSLAKSLCQVESCKLFVVGRRAELLYSLSEEFPGKIFPFPADIGEESGRQSILEKVREHNKFFTHIVHNAAIIEPVGGLKDLTLLDYRKQQAINTEAPLFLTKDLLPFMSPGGRVLFISSDAAFNPYKGLVSYAISKAALEMVYQSYKLEYKDSNLRFASLMPGGVHTPIAEFLSKTPPSLFPDAAMVAESIQKGEMLSPDFVARFIKWVLLESVDKDYSKNWDIDNEQDRTLWLTCEQASEEKQPAKGFGV